MSTPTSSAVVSTPFATAKNPFCNLGEFNGRECPARSLPAELRDLQLGSTWTIEFNEVPDDGVYTKNHITSRVSFVDDYIDEQGTSYPGAMVSMELADDIFEVVDNGEPGVYFNHILSSGVNYFPGNFRVKLLKYDGPTISSRQSRTFNFIGSLTLCGLVDLVINQRMDEFVFLSYNNKWKGCGDFIMQMWALLVRLEKLEKFPEGYETLLSRDLCVTYLAHEAPADCPVGKGCWVRWPRFTTGEDGLVPLSVNGTEQEDA